MAKEARQIEQDFIATASEKTGHSLDEWLRIIGTAGMDKPNAIIKWLKTEHALNHLQSSILAGIYLNDGKPVHDYDVLFRKLFDGKEGQQPIYEALKQLIQANMDTVLLIPTKTYVSIEADKVFGCAKINKTNVRVGLDLGELPFGDVVQPAKGLGAMPNLSHMVEVTEPEEINAELLTLLQQAYDRTH